MTVRELMGFLIRSGNLDDELIIADDEDVMLIDGVVHTHYGTVIEVIPKPTESRPKGKWKMSDYNAYKCNICNTTWDAPSNYCPNCGAEMESEK